MPTRLQLLVLFTVLSGLLLLNKAQQQAVASHRVRPLPSCQPPSLDAPGEASIVPPQFQPVPAKGEIYEF